MIWLHVHKEVPMSPKRVWKLFAALVFCAAFLPVAQALEPQRETRNLTESFDSVRLQGDIDVILTQSDSTSLVVEARPDLLGRIKSEVRNGELILSYSSPLEIHLGSYNHSPRALLSMKALKRITIEGSGDVHATSWSSRDDLELSITGSGNVAISNLTARELRTRLSGSGDARLSGTVSSADIRINGSGDFEASDLRSANVAVSIAGSGDASVWAERSLSISIAGSGDVEYFGRPTVSQSIAGSGDVHARGDKL